MDLREWGEQGWRWAGRRIGPDYSPIREAMGLQSGAQLTTGYVDGKIEIDYAPVDSWVRIPEDGLPIIETSSDKLHLDDDIREGREESYRKREEHWM